jgi:hypothetical protein
MRRVQRTKLNVTRALAPPTEFAKVVAARKRRRRRRRCIIVGIRVGVVHVDVVVDVSTEEFEHRKSVVAWENEGAYSRCDLREQGR